MEMVKEKEKEAQKTNGFLIVDDYLGGGVSIILLYYPFRFISFSYPIASPPFLT